MSYQEVAKSMIDRLPEDKIVYLINIMENIGEMSGIDIHPRYTPDAETLSAIESNKNKCCF